MKGLNSIQPALSSAAMKVKNSAMQAAQATLKSKTTEKITKTAMKMAEEYPITEKMGGNEIVEIAEGMAKLPVVVTTLIADGVQGAGQFIGRFVSNLIK